MSNLKAGMIATTMIIFYLAFGLMLFIGIKGLILQYTISAKTDFQVALESDDQGTEILSLLKSGNNMDILGDFGASDSVDLSAIENMLGKMRSIEGKDLALNVFGKRDLGDSKGTKKIISDIPLAGGKVGRIEMLV